MEAVRVIARIRPPSERDIEMKNKVIAAADTNQGTIVIDGSEGDAGGKIFSYDATYGPNDVTSSMFEKDIKSIAEGALQGYNGTVFAYGQTGSGKSYTMYGSTELEKEGIVFSAIDHIYALIANLPEKHRTLVSCTFLEIYKEEIRDLLPSSNRDRNQTRPPSGLTIRQDANSTTYADGLNIIKTANAKECRKVVQRGLKLRQQAATKMNSDSSRSHAIFTLTIEVYQNHNADDGITIGKLNFVDLAGSERQSKTENEKDRQDESIKINLSLTTLGRVIQILSEGVLKHIPYRDSKLTRLLEHSLGGNAKTVMICCISPTDDNRDESLNTLAYASRTKKIKNRPVINTDTKGGLLAEHIEKIRRLEAQVANTPNIETELEKEGNRIREELRREHLRELSQLEEERETTRALFEKKIKLASEEEKLRLTAEKEQEICRIQDELARRQKDEFRRLEMQKAEEYSAMEKKLRKAFDQEKLVLNDKLVEQQSEMETKRKMRMVEFERELRERLTREHECRIAEEKRRLEQDYLARYDEEKARLEEQATLDLETLKTRSAREQESERERLTKQKAKEIQRITDEKAYELELFRDKIQQQQEGELRRIREEQAEKMTRMQESSRLSRRDEDDRLLRDQQKTLRKEKEYEIQLIRDEHQFEVQSLLNQLNEARSDRSPDLLQRENEKLLRRVQNLQITLKNKDAQTEDMILSHQRELDALNESHSQELRQTKAGFDTEKKHLREEWKNKYNDNLLEVTDQHEEEIRKNEEHFEELQRDDRNEILTLQRTAKNSAAKLTSVLVEVDQLRSQNKTLKAERDTALFSLDDYEQNHVGCLEIQQDQQQKNKELQKEIGKLQKQIAANKQLQRRSAGSRNNIQSPTRESYREELYSRSSSVQRISGSATYRVGDESMEPVSYWSPVPSVFPLSVSSKLASSGRPTGTGKRSLLDPQTAESSGTRRKALLEAVAGVSAERFLVSAKEEYEKKLDHYVQNLENKDQEIQALKKQIQSTSPQGRSPRPHEGRTELAKQEQITLLYQQILSSIVPCLPDAKFVDINRIAKSAVWNDVSQKWKLQPLLSKHPENGFSYQHSLDFAETDHWRNPSRGSSVESFDRDEIRVLRPKTVVTSSSRKSTIPSAGSSSYKKRISAKQERRSEMDIF